MDQMDCIDHGITGSRIAFTRIIVSHSRGSLYGCITGSLYHASRDPCIIGITCHGITASRDHCISRSRILVSRDRRITSSRELRSTGSLCRTSRAQAITVSRDRCVTGLLYHGIIVLRERCITAPLDRRRTGPLFRWITYYSRPLSLYHGNIVPEPKFPGLTY